MTKLKAVLDLLRPALRGYSAQTGKECDLIANHATGSIDLLIKETRRVPLLSAEEIDDRSYMVKFRSRVLERLSQ